VLPAVLRPSTPSELIQPLGAAMVEEICGQLIDKEIRNPNLEARNKFKAQMTK
jgi:hypothetical protein